QLSGLWHDAGAAYGIPWPVLAAINKVESDFGRNMGPSSAGAIGWMQFMPSTWLRWGVDADGDGGADPGRAADAVYAAARYRAAALARVEARVRRRADTAPLLSDRLDARKQAVQLDVRRQALLTRVARAKARLAAAERQLEAARSSARTASFDPSARTLLTTDYVFPVGGGPSVVFASHTHHDYPAVDIAAPM